MIVKPIKTKSIRAGEISIYQLLDKYVKNLKDKDIVVLTSKIVSLCQNNVVPVGSVDKEDLIKEQADLYTSVTNPYGSHFTVIKNTLMSSAGIDESNGSGNYVLWPKDPQKTANNIREYLVDKHNIKYLGVIITDSTSTPFRRGASGIALAHSGFIGLNNYIGTPDLFNRPYTVSMSNVSGGLAAAAVVAMGEGNEGTPLCLISEVPLVTFQDRNPSKAELEVLKIDLEDEILSPFLLSAKWESLKQKGKSNVKPK